MLCEFGRVAIESFEGVGTALELSYAIDCIPLKVKLSITHSGNPDLSYP